MARKQGLTGMLKQFRKEIETQAEVRQSADALEGRSAFVEKRKAAFSGR